MIYILSGDIRSGKTTALLNWSKGLHDVDGLLCPDGENDKRYFLKIKSQKEIELEAKVESKNTISIGPFLFLKSAFNEANNYLLEVNERREFKCLVIDELGKLELKNEGLHYAAKVLIPQYLVNEHFHLILVIRVSLLDLLLKHYAISKYKLLSISDIKTFDLD